MERKVLSDGKTWIDVLDVEEVPQRARRKIRAIAFPLAGVVAARQAAAKATGTPLAKGIAALGLSEEQLDAMFRVEEATAAAFLGGWSRPEPVPTAETIGDLPSWLYDEIAAIAGPRGAALTLDTEPSMDADPNAPSGSSEPSGTPSKDDSELPSTPTSPSDGGPSPIES